MSAALEDREEMNLNQPSIFVAGRDLVVTGRWLRIASVKDEEVSEVSEAPDDLNAFMSDLKRSKLPADLVTIPESFTQLNPRHSAYHEFDNMAALRLTTYDDWWNSLSQETRRNVRKAGKQGVETKVSNLDDIFLRGVKAIYDETPVRQGRNFPHYQKDFERVKAETSTFPERSTFIGAYRADQMLGFMKLIYKAGNAHIIHFLSLNSAYDLRPANALLDQAVKVCTDRGLSLLFYRKYVYGKSGKSSLTEFKRRNGFEELKYPRYYLPLGTKGRLALSLRLHHGLKELLPSNVVAFVRQMRSDFLEAKNRRKIQLGAGIRG